MPRHNVIYVDTIVCLSEDHQGLSRCIVGHPTRVNVTSLSRGNHFHRSIKGAYNCKHSRGRSILLSPRGLHLGAQKYLSPLRPPLPSVGRPSVRLKYSFAIGRISSPTLPKNNKLFST